MREGATAEEVLSTNGHQKKQALNMLSTNLVTIAHTTAQEGPYRPVPVVTTDGPYDTFNGFLSTVEP
jgi:hypothetical protein